MSELVCLIPEIKHWRAVVIAGPAGCGKSSVGRVLADRLGNRFIDADDYHTNEAKKIIDNGGSVDDEYRERWLHRILGALFAYRRVAFNVVVACSALSKQHRMLLTSFALETGVADAKIVIAYLDVPEQELLRRLTVRQEIEGHMAGPEFLPGQLAAMERPEEGEEDVIIIPYAERSVDSTAEAVWNCCPQLQPFWK